jgi:drug/metabolite transporter (DMT)-like permease
MNSPSRGGATLVGGVAILLWSGLALLTAATGVIPPFELAALTFAVGGTLGLVVTLARGRLGALRQPPVVWLVGVGGLFGYHALYFAALRLAPPAQAGLIAYLWPLLIVLLSALLPGERLHPSHVLGAMLGFAGVVVLIGGANGGFSPERQYAAGYALALCCALLWSGYSVLSRRLKDVPTEAVAGFCLATAALAAIGHALFEATVWPATGQQAAAVLGLGLGPVGLAFYVWDIGVKHGDIRLLGVASYAAPVLSTLLLVAAGYAAGTLSLALACGLIVAGAVVATLAGRTVRVGHEA